MIYLNKRCDKMEMNQKIKELRLMRGMTLEQVGDLVGVGKSTVKKWESGQIANMRRDKIAKLAYALGTTPAYLMGWENESTNEEKPPTPEEQEQEARTKEFIELFRLLPPEYQVLILTQIRGLLTQLK